MSILFLLLSLYPPCFSSSQPLPYPSSSPLNHTWINQPRLSSNSSIRPILLSPSLTLACGFFCSSPPRRCLFSVFLATGQLSGTGQITFWSPQVVWSANRDRMVGENATLELAWDGNLILRDADGALVWSSNTSGVGVAGLALEESGNLVLADAANKTQWQSFDHPTDVMLLGQVLKPGMKLVARVSSSNYSEGPYYISMEKDGLHWYAAASEPQEYWNIISHGSQTPYAKYANGSFAVTSGASYTFPATNWMQFIKLGSDGILRVYAQSGVKAWSILYDFFAEEDNVHCSTPGNCGRYGLCTGDNQCSCLQNSSGNSTLSTDSFTPVNSGNPAQGCVPHMPLVCNSRNGSGDYHFLQVNNIDYFALDYLSGNSTDSLDECKHLCLQDCSCKAAFFTINLTYLHPKSTCYKITEVYTLRTNSKQYYNSVALIKMQNLSPPPSPSVKTSRAAIIGGTTLGIVTVISLLVLGCLYKRKRSRREAEDDKFLKSVPGLPSRFSLRDLRDATDNFRSRLGSGGFGTVYLGVLPGGTRIAVKRLDRARQGQKEFRAEVCTIGSIHHFNLVRLFGFCAEREDRLLVYEHMPNGSLDRWLFSTGDGLLLNWDTRFSIAVGTARGLSYLHEDCTKRIIHLDVKPQNILLDEHFVAKVSDFGFSKLMDRDQSHVVTTMRGTPGYLAPEWLHSTVTEKADVYSFGILMLEIVSGRKCLNASDSQEAYMPEWANLKAKEGKLLELLDVRLGAAFDEAEAKRAIEVALWCIQSEAAARPSMSSVVQMLEGVMEVPPPPLIFPHLWNARTTGNDYNNISSGSDMPKESIPFASEVSVPR